jgi:hypothetical protein
MPGKVNPTQCEALTMVAAQVSSAAVLQADWQKACQLGGASCLKLHKGRHGSGHGAALGWLGSTGMNEN